MLVTVSNTITENQTIELPIPYFAKHKQYDWFYMVTEFEVLEVLPWYIKVEERNNFLTGYENKVSEALKLNNPITAKEFIAAFKAAQAKQTQVLIKNKLLLK